MPLAPPWQWKLRNQFTLVALVVTFVAIFVTTDRVDEKARETLYEHEAVDLREETALRTKEVQDEITGLGRNLRDAATALSDRLRKGLPPGGPASPASAKGFPKKWADTLQQLVKLEGGEAGGGEAGRSARGTPGRDFDKAHIEWAALYEPGGPGHRAAGNSKFRGGRPGPWTPGPPGAEPAAARGLVSYCFSGNARDAIAETSGFQLERRGGEPALLLCLAGRVAGGAGDRPPAAVLVVAINLTRYFDDLSRRSPRHLYYLLDHTGRYLYHPVPERTGTTVHDPDPRDPLASLAGAWQEPGRATTAAGQRDADLRLLTSRGLQLLAGPDGEKGVPLPGREFFHDKRDLSPPDTSDQVKGVVSAFNAEMAAFADRPEGEGGPGPGLRFGELVEGVNRVAVSHPTAEGLRRAKAKADELLAGWPAGSPPGVWERTLRAAGAPGDGWYRRRRWYHPPGSDEGLACRRFALQLAVLDPGFTTPPLAAGPRPPAGYAPKARLVSAAAVEEIEGDMGFKTRPQKRVTTLAACLAAAALTAVLARYIAGPLQRIEREARRLADRAGRVAETEADPSKSGEQFAVSLPTTGPREVTAVAAAFRDMVGQLERMTTRLRRRTAEMRAVYRTAVDGILLFNDRGEITETNDAAERMFGYDPGRLVGERVQRLFRFQPDSPLALGPGADPEASTFSTGGSRSLRELIRLAGLELPAVRRDGTEFWAEAGFSEVESGGRTIFTGIVRDVSDRKAADEAIRRANAALDQRVKERTAELSAALKEAEAADLAKLNLLHSVSHELRTPLAAITNTAEMFFHPKAAALLANPLPRVKTIKVASEMLRHLVENLLLAFEVQAARQTHTVNRSEVRLNPFLDETVDILKPIAAKYQNDFAADVPPDLGEVWTDQLKLRQVLLNLIGNACKYASRRAVRVEVRRTEGPAGDEVQFHITDAGAGMSPETLRRLGEPFYRGEGDAARQETGTGLGMMVTKTLVGLLGGELDIRSEVGRGTTVRFSFPAGMPDPGPAGRPAVRADGGGGQRVVVVDDDPLIRETLAAGLRQDGFDVYPAGSGDEGLETVRRVRPMAVTLDVMMPNKDGWAVLGELKSDPATRDIPVVMLSLLGDRGRGAALGAVDFLTKPVDRRHLLAVLRRLAVTGSVLVVEDDGPLREQVCEALAREGWAVTPAANGREALDRLAAARPALILLDLLMPEMDGFEFLDRLRQSGGDHPPVVVMTALTLTDDDRRRLNGRVTAVLQKQAVSGDELVAWLRRWLASQPAGAARPPA